MPFMGPRGAGAAFTSGNQPRFNLGPDISYGPPAQNMGGGQFDWGEVLGPALNFAGDVAGGFINNAGVASANDANRKISREQMAFQEYMSNTAHQREVADYVKAGGNPAFLLAKGGSGASTPAGASAQMQNELAGLGSGVTSAGQFAHNMLSLEQQKAALAQQRANVKITESEAKYRDLVLSGRLNVMSAQENLAGAQQGGVEAQRAVAIQQARWLRETFGLRQSELVISNALMQAQTHGTNANTAVTKAQLPGYLNMQRADESWWGRNIRPYISDAAGVGRAVSSFMPKIEFGPGGGSGLDLINLAKPSARSGMRNIIKSSPW